MNQTIMNYELARNYPSDGLNCIGGSLFLRGIYRVEQYHPPGFLNLGNGFRMTYTNLIEIADFVGLEVRGIPFSIFHLAVPHPENSLKVIHRPGHGRDFEIESIEAIRNKEMESPNLSIRYYQLSTIDTMLH
jgi:hypothetical protein